MNFFDKKIRESLESISPLYEESAWTRLKKSMPIPWYLTALKEYGGWMVAAAVSGLSLYIINDNFQLKNKLNDANSILNTMKKSDNKLVAKTETILKTDTVYVTKYINNTKIEEQVLAEFKLAKTKNSFTQPIIEKEIVGVKNSKSKLENGKISDVNVKENILVESNIETLTPNQNSIAVKINDSLKNSEQSDQKIAEQKSDSTIVEEIIELDQKIQKAESAMIKAIKNINFKIGLTGNVSGFQSASFGPNIEIMLGKRWGINTGLNFYSSEDIKYNAPNEFNKKTGKRFEDVIKPYIENKQQDIKNIEIHNTQLMVPVNLSFYYPINYKLEIIINSGLNFNLYQKEEVSFEGRKPQESSYLNRFDRQNNSGKISSLNYAMGLQYHTGRLYFQLMPSFNYSLESNDFRARSNNKIGLTGAVRFGFGK